MLLYRDGVARESLPPIVESGESQRNMEEQSQRCLRQWGSLTRPWRGGVPDSLGKGVRMTGAGEGLGGRGQSRGGRRVEGPPALL